MERYPAFVPLCERHVIRSRRKCGEAEILITEMTVAYALFRETFRTRVTLDRQSGRILVHAIEGPLRQLETRWTFQPRQDGSCDVGFYLSYELASRTLALLMGAVFDAAFARFVEAFERRADIVYGRRSLARPRPAAGCDRSPIPHPQDRGLVDQMRRSARPHAGCGWPSRSNRRSKGEQMRGNLRAQSSAASGRVALRRAREPGRADPRLLEFAALPFRSTEIRVPSYLQAHLLVGLHSPQSGPAVRASMAGEPDFWGNYTRLSDAALAEMGASLPGRTLQVACVYGDLTNQLTARVVDGDGSLDIVDVLPIQLSNLRQKLPRRVPVRLLAMDAAHLNLPDVRYDRALVFFLLHEQPEHYRVRTLSELCRVVKPGGKIVVVDYALPRWWHPLRYIWRPLLASLEPFALDLWRDEIAKGLPREGVSKLRKQSFFGGLYQMVVITR